MSKHSLSGRGRRPVSLCTPRQSTCRDLHQPSHGTSRRGNSSGCSQPQSPFHEDFRRERDALRAELEAERLCSEEARRRFAVEARELREAAQRDQQLLAEKLRSKWEKEQIHQLQNFKEQTKKQRDAEIRDLLRWKRAELYESQEFLKQERDVAVRQSRDLQRELAKQLVIHGNSSRGTRGDCSGGTECRAEIEEVLAKLRWDVDSDQVTQIRHLEAQLELERRLVLKYVLERFDGVPLFAASLARFMQASSPPKGKVIRWGAAGEHAPGGLRQPGGLPCDSCTQPMKQNAADPSNALKILGEENTLQLGEIGKQCENLRHEVEGKQKLLQQALAGITREENTLLRKNSFSDMQDQVNILKRKCADLAVIAQRLQEAAKKLQEPNLRVGDTPELFALTCSDRELWEKVFAQQQAKDLNEQASVLLAKDQQIEALQKELQAVLSSRQIAVSSQRDSLQTSKIAANGSSATRIMQQTSTIHVRCEDSFLAKKKPKTLNLSKKNAELQALPFSNKAKNYKNSSLKRDSKSESHLKFIEEQLLEKQRQCENLRHEVEEKQGRWNEAEQKLHKILSENARLSEENSQLHEKNKRAEKMAHETLLELHKKEGEIEELKQALAGITREENTLLRKSNFPDMEDKMNVLKRKHAELATIARRLQEAAKKLQESSLRVSNTPGPLALNCSDRELWEQVIGQQQANDLNEQASVLLAKDQQIEALQKECQELQAKLSSRKENHSLHSSRDLDRLLRESQREVPRLQGQIALKSQRHSLQTSRIAADSLEDPSLAKKKLKIRNILQKDGESQALTFSNEAKNDKNSSLKRDSENESHLQLLEKQLLEKQSRCENLMYEVEEKQKRCNEVELKLHTILSENVRLSEESSQLRGKNKWAEKMAHENADLRVKIIEATKERNSAVQLTQGLEVKVENLEQVLMNMKEKAEVEPLEQVQTEMKREHDEEVQFLETQVKELEHRYPSQREHVNLLNPEDTRDEGHLKSDNPRPFRLQCVLARYSYDPFSGPNKNPEAELPLTAGEYVYICGGLDEDGFYVGELKDGRRGLVPSNLVEEIDDNDVFSFIPSETSSVSHDSDCEPGFSCQSASCEGKSNSPDDGPEGTLCQVPPAEPSSKNLALLTLWNITTTSAEITWSPSNDNYTRLVYLNKKKYDIIKANMNSYTFQNLRPSTKYSVKVETLVPQGTLESPQSRLQQEAREMEFTTPSSGPPHPPTDVQVQAGSSADILVISWLPETIHSSGLSNGVKVTGYGIYLSGQKVSEIMSPTAGSISLEVSEINTFQGAQAVSVRTVSLFGESADSVPALIPSDLQKVPSTVLSPSVAPGLSFQTFLESEGRPVLATEDTNKKRSEACLTQNRILPSKPDIRKVCMMTGEESSSQSSLENCDANNLSPESRSSSLEFEPRTNTDIGIYNVCFQDLFPKKDQGKQIKQGWQGLSELTVPQVEAQEDKTFRRKSWQFSVGDYSHHCDLSDVEEEEEEDRESPWDMSDEDVGRY